MVEDLNLHIKLLDDILSEGRRSESSFSDRAGLFAALGRLQEDVKAYIDEASDFDRSYASEKLSKFCWHVRALLGFDIDNGHDSDQHVSWALGEMGTLKNLLHGGGHIKDRF